METDRELLELAAKAAELQCKWDRTFPNMLRVYDARTDRWPKWDPLGDDGEALRLAVKLGLEVSVAFAQVYACRFGALPGSETSEPHGSDAYAATRRAIVRAAAAIGGSRRSEAAQPVVSSGPNEQKNNGN